MTRLTGADIELAIGEAQPLIDPRLSEVDWDAVATALVTACPPARLDVDRLRGAIYAVSLRPNWAQVVDREDRTEEIAAEYEALA